MSTRCHTTPLSAPLEDGEDLPRARFLNELAGRGLVHLGHDHFSGDVDPAAAAALGDPVLIRAKADGSTLEAFVRLEGGVLLLLDFGYGSVTVEAAAAERATVDAALERLRGALAEPEPEEHDVPFSFWSSGARGRGKVRRRNLEAAAWADLRANYTAPTAARLDALMRVREPERGRLILWHGVPGTGKTHALRALGRAWREWCSVHCVLDPEALLSPDPGYLLDVLAWEEDGWRLIILEDAGELARLDGGRGSGMPQLLNLTDGLMGQGARALVLITTNEPAAAINPALRRPGRCLAEVGFAPLSAAEASRWLDAELTRPHTISELFARREGEGSGDACVPSARPAFGFGRAILSEVLKPDPERVISR
jgi:hypothetical protein